jgi:hypothetical protein
LSSGRAGSNSYKPQKNLKLIVKNSKNIVKIIQAIVAIILLGVCRSTIGAVIRQFFSVPGDYSRKVKSDVTA